MLETTPGHLNTLQEKANSNRNYCPLLGADIVAVLRSVINKNPNVYSVGIEETDVQKENRKRDSGSRDKAIATNFWNAFQIEKRHVILFG